MTDLATLQSLLARVLAATGPDREIDAAIWEATEPHKYLYARSGRNWVVNRMGTVLTPVWELCADPRPAFTASIDAAMALVERRIRIDTGAFDLISRALVTATRHGIQRGGKISDYLPLALIAATIRAEIAKLEATGSAAE